MERSQPDLAAYSALHLAVPRPPDPNEIDESSTDGWRDKLDAQEASWRADHLIEQLRSTGAFAGVTYSDAVGTPPSAIVKPLRRSSDSGPSSVNSVMLTMFTLGIVPVYERYDNGLHFPRLDRRVPDFHCDWPVQSVVGWLGLALRLSPRWEYGFADAAREARFRSCLESFGAENME